MKMTFRSAGKSLTKNLASFATALVLTAGLASTSKADLIQFRPEGSGTTYATGGLGFGPGSAVAQNVNPSGALVVGTVFQFTYQTHLTSLTGVNAVEGLNTRFQITEVGTLTEVVTSVTTVGGVTTATFALVPGATNRISIYFNNAVVFNDAAGTGFTAGTEIARLSPTNFNASQYSTPNTQSTFNQSGLGGKNSGSGNALTGSGSSSLNSGVTTSNSAFFVTQPLQSSIFNANISSVFDTAAPSLQFTNPITSVSFASNIGSVNALSGPDIQFQISGLTNSFTVVPEPASIAMTVLGLGGVAAGSYRARRRARA